MEFVFLGWKGNKTPEGSLFRSKKIAFISSMKIGYKND